MKIPTIGVEEWLNIYEKSATYDIAQSTISALTMDELLHLDGLDPQEFYDLLNTQQMHYGWIEGSKEFKEEVSKLYQTRIPLTNILQTNGATGANLNAIMAIIEEGDHVIAEYPTYAPLYEIPRSLGATVDYWHVNNSPLS